MRFPKLALAVSLLAAIAAQPALAEQGGGTIRVSAAWSRATPPAAEVGAAYFVMANLGGAPDRLLRAASPVARRVELHVTRVRDGVATMRPLGAVEIAPQQRVTFAPGGKHAMLMGLAQPLAEGDRFPLTLVFEKAGTVTVEVTVRGLAATGSHHRTDPARMHR